MDLVSMKKLLIIAAAFLVAFILTEFTVRYILKYPVYGVEKKVNGLRNPNINLPYAKYWDVEGGNHLYKLNNVGLPGEDINIKAGGINIFILGTSYIEAKQTPPSDMATSVFQKLLRKQSDKYQVINLGTSADDAYDSYFRAAYFEKSINPDYVVLLIDELHPYYFKRHPHPLSFQIPANFGTENNSFVNKTNIFFRNHFALINIIAHTLKLSSESSEKNTPLEKKTSDIKIKKSEIEISPDLFLCIKEFKNKYKENFLCLSIIDNDTINQSLNTFCSDNEINFDYNCINTKSNKINGIGHLTSNGNNLLGNFFYDTFTKFYKKQRSTIIY
jgi:predicted transcriptional regulator